MDVRLTERPSSRRSNPREIFRRSGKRFSASAVARNWNYTNRNHGMFSINKFAGLAKAEYLLRPHQIVRKIWREAKGQHAEVRTVRLPWGLEIAVHTADSLGWALYTRAIYETTVTEALWRLVQPGDTVVDAGANIGYMTSVMAVRVGRSGKVYSFEPHPGLFEELQQNVAAWKKDERCGSFWLHQAALGAEKGHAQLYASPAFSANRGVARIEAAAPSDAETRFQVAVLALDDVIPKTESIRVVKLDVEGYELAVLHGMAGLLRARRVQHVVFEEHKKFPSPAHQFLSDLGYVIFGIDRQLSGIRLIRDQEPSWDPVTGTPPNYLATIEPELALTRLQSGIWQSFGPAQLVRRWF
jgi:FkbM family methyltransferase